MTNYDILKEYEAHQTPVPSYDEWEKLNWYAGNGVEENQELKMENTKLKELLKESKKLFVLEKGFMVKCTREEQLSDIITKIDEVLK